MAKLLSGTRIYGNASVDTNLVVSGNTISTSSATGALTVLGGVGIVGNLNIGTNLTVTGTTTFTGNILGNTTYSANVIALGFFYANGTAVGGGAGTPGGSTTQIQYNNAGSFAGAANLTYIVANGQVVIGSGLSTTSNVSGALRVTGGIGVSGNVYVGNSVGWVYPNNVSSVYQVFNNTSASLDTVFG
jgi:hypothetical protein